MCVDSTLKFFLTPLIIVFKFYNTIEWVVEFSWVGYIHPMLEDYIKDPLKKIISVSVQREISIKQGVVTSGFV